MDLPEKFKFTFSKGSPWTENFLHQYAKKHPSSEFFKVSKKLYKEILKINTAITSEGLPSNLELAHVNNQVHTGVFLKPDKKAIPVGTLIGVYTGFYELVPSDLTSCNSYAYDVAQQIHLKKDQLKEVIRHEKPLDTYQEYSIQTNAIEAGNFTRFINHSSLKPNIEAVVAKFPDSRIEILLFALHTIKPGEQLLSNYGGQYWKALNIIPNDMASNTYLLDSSYKVRHANPISPFPEKVKTLLSDLRNESIEIPDNLISTSILKKFKKAIPSLSEKHKKQIDDWENILVERGIPRNLSLINQKESWSLSLDEKSKSIRKGALIGAFSGTFLTKKTRHCIKLAHTTKTDLFLDLTQNGNCLSLLEEDCLKGNTIIRPMYDKDTDSFYILLFASKLISPKDPLTLCFFEPLFL